MGGAIGRSQVYTGRDRDGGQSPILAKCPRRLDAQDALNAWHQSRARKGNLREELPGFGMDASAIVNSTTDPAFAVDARGRIGAWNEAAERFFGLAVRQVLGRCCFEVVKGRDVFGNDYCSQSCPLRTMARAHRPTRPCDLVFDDPAGVPSRVRVTTIRSQVDAKPVWSLVHLLSPATAVPAPPNPAPRRESHRVSRLTAREAEVLDLCADGYSTARMAEELGVSVATVRNHIQRTLGKLRVHSRLEAVALGRRLGLVR